MNLKRLALHQIFILFFSIVFVFNSSSQIAEKTVPDSIKILPVKLSQIPIRSSETLMRTRRILEKLYSDQQIAQLKNRNDSILNLVEKKNITIDYNNTEARSIRYLETQILQLKYQMEIVDKEKNKISRIFNDLEESINYIKTEQKIWTKTRTAMSESGFTGTVLIRINSILDNLEQTNLAISSQAEEMISVLDRSSEITAEMNQLTINLELSIRKMEEQMVQNDYPSIFNLNYSIEKIKFKGAFRNYAFSEWNELKSYLGKRFNEIFILFFLFGFFIYVFLKFKNIFIEYKTQEGNYYTKTLGIILSKPWSASIVLTLLSTFFLFPDSPPAVRDAIGFMYVIPIVIIMKQLLYKRLLFYIYGFAVLMVFNVFFLMLPPENIIYRYTLLLISFAEIYLTSYFLFYTLKRLHFSKKNISIFRFIGYVFLIMAILGFFGSVSGDVNLAQKQLLAVNYSVLASAILYAAVVIINGLFITLIDSPVLSKVNVIIVYGDFLKKRIVAICNSLAIIYAIYFLLNKLFLWNSLKDGVLGFLSRQWSVGNTEFSIGTIVVFFLVIYISATVGKILQIILEEDVLERMPLKKGIPHTISMMIKYSLITIGVFLAVSATGIETSSLTVIIGAFGVGIGFGLQNIFNNLISGLILLFERPVQIGDTIEVGALIGQVNSIGIRSSNIKTFDGAEVIVPNGHFISNEVINWTLSDQQRRIEIIVGVSYKSDPHQVYDILMKVLDEHKEIMTYPKPVVLFNEMGESSLNFRLLFWTQSYTEWLRIKSEVIFKIFDLLKENNIEIPFPQRDLHIKTIHENMNIKNLEDESGIPSNREKGE